MKNRIGAPVVTPPPDSSEAHDIAPAMRAFGSGVTAGMSALPWWAWLALGYMVSRSPRRG